MSEWSNPPGRFSDEGYFDDRYPKHVQRAFIVVRFQDIEDAYNREEEITYDMLFDSAIQSFATRWGGVSDENFLHALSFGQGADRLVAIFALGQSPDPQMVESIIPLLQSANLLERYAAVVVLTLRRDERAIPVLEQYFIQNPPGYRENFTEEGLDVSWYSTYHGHLARVIANWGPPELTPILQKAFLKLLEQQQRYGGSESIYYAQEALLYALGRRGAVSALHGISLPTIQRRLAMNFLALGYVRADERFDDIYYALLLNQEGVQKEITQVFIQFFALSEEESQQCIRMFGIDYFQREGQAIFH